jgi:hypothetical protein
MLNVTSNTQIFTMVASINLHLARNPLNGK